MLPTVAHSAEERSSRLVITSRPSPGVCLLALNQPDRRNALTQEMAGALRNELAAIATDAGVRALVVTGVGTAFCAGADLGALGAEATTPGAKRRVLTDYYRAFLDLRDLAIPTIAAVNGPAIGAGLNLALCCDLRLLADNARLAAPFVKLGIHPGGGATWMLVRLAGPAMAREMLLLGEPISAERAFQVGLANRVVPAAELRQAALELATSLVGMSAPALRDLKHTLAAAESGEPLDVVLGLESEAQAKSLLTEDAREGWAAMRERRRAEFRDR